MLELVIAVLGAAALFVAWDFQRRHFQHKAEQRRFEASAVLDQIRAIEPLIAGQAKRDERNDKALAAFLTELRGLVQALQTSVQKQSAAQVEKLQRMSRPRS